MHEFLVSAVVIVFIPRNGLDKRVWNTLVAPVLGMGISVGLSRHGARVRLDQVVDEV